MSTDKQRCAQTHLEYIEIVSVSAIECAAEERNAEFDTEEEEDSVARRPALPKRASAALSTCQTSAEWSRRWCLRSLHAKSPCEVFIRTPERVMTADGPPVAADLLSGRRDSHHLLLGR